jgi:WD40 repeat protein
MKYPVKNLLLLEQVNLIIGDASPIITVWNLKLKAQIQQLRGHVSQVSALIQVRDSVLASGSFDCSIKIWNFADGHLTTASDDDDGALCSCIKHLIYVIDNASFAILGPTSSAIMIWDIDTKAQIRNLIGHTSECLALAKLEDDRLASSSRDGSIKFGLSE